MKKPEKNTEEAKKRRLANLRPPFKKGEKPPPGSGRPRGSRNMSVILKEVLKENFNPNPPKASELKEKLNCEVLGMQIVRRAIQKGGRDTEIIFDRTEGKAPERFIDETPQSDSKTEIIITSRIEKLK